MVLLKLFKPYCQMPPLLLKSPTHRAKVFRSRWLVVKGCQQEEQKSQRRSFLSLEEAGLVEISGLSAQERFLCRLTTRLNSFLTRFTL